MLGIKKPSKWTFETSKSKAASRTVGAAAILAIQGSKGAIYAHDADGGLTQFHYVDLGVGAGAGFVLPLKWSVTTAPKEVPSSGAIYILDTFPRNELEASDLTGMCMFTEASLGVGMGGSFRVMVFGITARSLAEEFQSEFWEIFAYGSAIGGASTFTVARLNEMARKVEFANAVLLMKGQTLGQVGASIVAGFGAVWIGDVDTLMPNVDLPFEPVPIALRSSSTAKELRLIVPNDILFDFDKDTIGTKRRPPAAARYLSRVASTVRSHAAYRITIVGYTDSIGSAGYNQKLSEKRANNVRDWLIRNGAVRADRFLAVRGEGESEPVAPNNNPRGRAKNRRVEIRLVPR